MKIIVVGATGTIGKAIAQALSGRHEIVRVSRTESTKTVQVNLIMSRNFHDRPPFPDVERACAELGYKGQVARFRDTEPRPRR